MSFSKYTNRLGVSIHFNSFTRQSHLLSEIFFPHCIFASLRMHTSNYKPGSSISKQSISILNVFIQRFIPAQRSLHKTLNVYKSKTVGTSRPLLCVVYFRAISAESFLMLSRWPILYWTFFPIQMCSYLPFLYLSVNATWTEIIESPDHTFIFLIYYAV